MAKNADRLLTFLSKKGTQFTFNASVIEHHFQDISPIVVRQLIDLLLDDGYIHILQHPHAPEHDFGFYTLSSKGNRFIQFDGGYTELRRLNYWKKTNIHFTWIRHWVWFYTSVISVLFNIYFLYHIFFR